MTGRRGRRRKQLPDDLKETVWIIVWYAEYAPCIPDSNPHRITSTGCHINTFVSPDDGHIVARNTYEGC